MSESPTATPSGFAELGLSEVLAARVAALGFEAPTAVQAACVPPLLAGRDVIARARTGSGKTAAYGLPLLQRLAAAPGAGVRALVLCPTRELALQVTDALRGLATDLPLRIACVYGGVAYEPQLQALRKGAAVIVGTPGRVLDLVDRGALALGTLEVLVLDEADEMLRMGFVDDVERVVAAAPPERQVALLSATVPDPIRAIAARYLRDPVEIAVEAKALATDHVTQKVLVVQRHAKIEALCRWIATQEREGTLVFARTRAGCAELADALDLQGLASAALHGDLTQAAREDVLGRFRSRRIEVLVATDVAARGLDVEHITHVVNFDLPDDAEVYVHRIGRTARAGRSGTALTLALPSERMRMRRIAQAVRATLEEARVPSDGEIAHHRRADLVKTLGEVPDHARARARALLAELGATEDLALAALALLCRDRRIPLPDAPAAAEAPPAPEGPEELFVAAGRRHGVTADALARLILATREVEAADMGPVRIFERKSFVSMPHEALERLLAARATLAMNGVDVKLARARLSP